MLQHTGYARTGAAHVLHMTETQMLFKATALDYLEHDGPVTVIRPLSPDTDRYDPEVGPMFKVRSAAGVEFDAFADELRDPPSPGFREAFDKFIARGRDDWPDVDGKLEHPLRADATVSPESTESGPSVDEVVARVMDETPDGDAFNLNDALRLAVRIARGEV